MQQRVKSWLWRLTWPFAHANYTTIRETLYYPAGSPPTKFVIRHEEIHARQQREMGLTRFLLLYLLCLPVGWNPWRWKWEAEAYRDGSGYSDSQICDILRSPAYGWLRRPK